MTVQNRIREYIKYERLTITKFCDTIGVSNAYISSIVKSIQPDKIQKISFEYPKLNIEWLLTGNGEMIKNDIKSDVPAQTETASDDIQKLKWTVDQLREANAELKRERDEAIREASKWETLARQVQVAGPAWDRQLPLEKTG